MGLLLLGWTKDGKTIKDKKGVLILSQNRGRDFV
jgi:hypothetical protein